MFRKLILSQSKLFQRPNIKQNQVLHFHGKKDGKQDISKQKEPLHEYKIQCICQCPPPPRCKNKIFWFCLGSLIGSIIFLSLFFDESEVDFECTNDDN